MYISYKIFMPLIMNFIEKHLIANGVNKEIEIQTGFTAGVRLEENLMIIKYYVEDA